MSLRASSRKGLRGIRSSQDEGMKTEEGTGQSEKAECPQKLPK